MKHTHRRLYLLILIALLVALGSPAFAQRAEAYKSFIDDQDGDTLELSNKAVVKVRGGRLGRLMSGRPDCLLFRNGLRWQIWIENEGLFDCDVEEDPSGMRSYATEATILEVKFNGEVLLMQGGSIYEVNSRDTRFTSRWEGNASALIFNERTLLNLDDPESLARVRKLR